MSEQFKLFDINRARQLRDHALKQMEENHVTWIEAARDMAWIVASEQGTVTADDIRRIMEEIPWEPPHRNCYGAIFTKTRFEATGQFVQSQAVARKGGVQRVWRLKP